MKKILILIMTAFLLFNCSFIQQEQLKQINEQRINKYPSTDSVSTYYRLMYMPSNTDTVIFFKTFMRPIKILKNNEWITFFMTIDGTAVYLYRGEFVLKQYINSRFRIENEQDQYQLNQ
jgi:hypothetical protein